MDDSGYINYFAILGLDETANPGEVRKVYRRKMKELVGEIARTQITEELKARYSVEIAKLNGAAYVLRDTAMRETYWNERQALIALEQRWCDEVAQSSGPEVVDATRREFDGRIRAFLSRYVEESMLEAGQDKEIMEASNWNVLHARYASHLLRHYRHRLHHDILARLPYHEVTEPVIDWDERKRTVADLIAGAGA